MNSIDSSNKNQSELTAKRKKGGRRPGAGRPKGRLSDINAERQAAKEQFIARVNAMVDPLFDAQATIAQGVSYLYRVDQDDNGHDKPAELVTDPDEIKSYIDSATEGGDSYYYITTERPDNRALDSLLNRAFGKPEEKIDITSKGKAVQSPAIISPITARDAQTETETAESD
jgi:hypothetical protein